MSPAASPSLSSNIDPALLPQPTNTVSAGQPNTEEDSTWEYEYDEHETEVSESFSAAGTCTYKTRQTFYITIDLPATYTLPTTPAKKPPPPGDERSDSAASADSSPARRGSSASTSTRNTERLSDKLQVVDLHTPEPLVSYQNHIYTCSWAENIGTEILFTSPDVVAAASLPTERSAAMYALLDRPSAARLVGKSVHLAPRIVRPSQKAKKPEPSATIPVADTVSEHTPRPAPTVSPEAATKSPLADITPLSTDAEISTSIEPVIPAPTDAVHEERPGSTNQSGASIPAEHAAASARGIDATLDAGAATGDQSTTVAAPADTRNNDTSSPPPKPPRVVKIPLGPAVMAPRAEQAAFLERLIVLKRARSEEDEVTVYARRINTYTGWRSRENPVRAGFDVDDSEAHVAEEEEEQQEDDNHVRDRNHNLADNDDHEDEDDDEDDDDEDDDDDDDDDVVMTGQGTHIPEEVPDGRGGSTHVPPGRDVSALVPRNKTRMEKGSNHPDYQYGKTLFNAMGELRVPERFPLGAKIDRAEQKREWKKARARERAKYNSPYERPKRRMQSDLFAGSSEQSHGDGGREQEDNG